MNNEPTMENIDLAHVAALALAIWIYLIGKNEDAIEAISKAAGTLHAEMVLKEEKSSNDEG
jgi:hypothetical protein